VTTDPDDLEQELRDATGPHAAHVITARADPQLPPAVSKTAPDSGTVCPYCPPDCPECPGDRADCECYRHQPGEDDPHDPVRQAKTAPDAQHPATVVEPLDLVDPDGDHIRFRLSGLDRECPVNVETASEGAERPEWQLRVVLNPHQLAELTAWALAVPQVRDLVAVPLAAGRPYTDEELAHTPSARRDAILTEQLVDDETRARS
jgi:hypothetical protein